MLAGENYPIRALGSWARPCTLPLLRSRQAALWSLRAGRHTAPSRGVGKRGVHKASCGCARF